MSTTAAGAVPKPKEGFIYTAGPALLSGASQAIIFNPIDRALYVRVRFRRARFLDRRNFQRPFQGFMNAAVYRTLVGASYMFWQDSVRLAIGRFGPRFVQAERAPHINSVLIGLTAGSINGFTLNMLQVVKFRMWNSNEKGVTFARTAGNMLREGGPLIFMRGCMTTVVRDSIFGMVYETARRSSAWVDFFHHYVGRAVALQRRLRGRPAEAATEALREETHVSVANSRAQCEVCTFTANLLAAMLASILSSPFNYVRSIVYGTPASAVPLGYVPLLRSFAFQVRYILKHGRSFTDSHSFMPDLSQVEHGVQCRLSASGAGGTAPGATTGRHYRAAWRWANSRLNIGWGSLRVGVGMAMTQSLFHLTQNYMRART